MTKQQLKLRLIAIRNGGFVSPLLEELWEFLNKKDKLDKCKLENKMKEISMLSLKETAEIILRLEK
jgi:hypothetical protein